MRTLLLAAGLCSIAVSAIAQTPRTDPGPLTTAPDKASAATEMSAQAMFVRCFFVAATNSPIRNAGLCVCGDRPGGDLAYAGFGAQAARLLRSSATVWSDRICGGVLLALAGTMALYRRASN
jgi:threonine/homoserine/homoserine lactone efflux protein